VLFLLFGSSAAGKTSALDELRDRIPDLAVHDHDEVGVPPHADTAWRQRANEEWVCRALNLQAAGTDMLLGAQTPLGELLAAPSATRLDAISACLLDCSDEVRVARLRERPAWRGTSDPTRWPDLLRWAEWMRYHATDPQWMPHVIRRERGHPEMRWERWSDWQSGDLRWRVNVIDTSALPIAEAAKQVAQWITDERALVRRKQHPLANWAGAREQDAQNR
jgi:hypothetical protein